MNVDSVFVICSKSDATVIVSEKVFSSKESAELEYDNDVEVILSLREYVDNSGIGIIS